RGRLRDALRRKDLRTLVALANSDEASRQLPLALETLGTVLRRMGDIGTAELVLRQARQRHPAGFWINHELAWTIDMAPHARHDDALRFYTAAVSLRPDSPGAHVNLGARLGKNGRHDEAIAEYREAIRLKDDYAQAHFNLGGELQEKGQLDEAV